MQLVEQHVIKITDPRFGPIDRAAFAAKNLYNKANYYIRQSFIHHRQYISYPEMDKQMQRTDEYRALPAKVAQQVLRTLDKAWQSFFASIREWHKTPAKFLGRPKLPSYKDKQKGRCLLTYTIQAISKPALLRGIVKLSKLTIEVQTRQSDIDQIRIVPRKGFYCVEVVYTVEPEPNGALDPDLVAGVDIGVNNLAAVTSNKPGFTPVVVNGRPLKATNQFYNKKKAQAQSALSGNRRTSNRIDWLTIRRNRRIKHYLHTASRRIIDHLVAEGIGTLVIGKNDNWKQSVSLGKRNNQTFVSIPHAQFVNMLTYKAQLAGIQVVVAEESYTSKVSFLDLEPVEKRDVYVGKRIERGLFRASNGQLINADVNASFNIIRKVVPDAFADGIEDVVVRPLGISIRP